MRSINKVLICFIMVALLYAPTDKVIKKDKTSTRHEGAPSIDGNRVWLEGARGWIESGTDFYPYSTGLDVGIGTTTPAYKLDVAGDMRITGGINDGVGFGLSNEVLVSDGLGGVAWGSAPGGSNAYIWNQYASAQTPASFWIAGRGKVIHSSPGASDTALVGITYDPGRRGVYGECADVDGAGVGVTGVGGYFGTASWYGPSAGYIGGVLGTYWGEGVWGLSDGAYGGWTGIFGDGRGAGVTGMAGFGNGTYWTTGAYWGGSGVSGSSDDVGTFGYGDATSLSFGVLGMSVATDGIGTYGLSSGAVMYVPPTGQDAGLFAAGKYYGIFAMGQRQIDYGIGVAGLGDSTTNLVYLSGAGVIGCGAVGVLGALNSTTYGVLGYSTTRANYFYHSEATTTDDQSTIYAYRTRSAANDGISYSTSGTNEAIQGYNYWGDVYTFGVSGHNYNDYTRCGGVLGADQGGLYWGSLGYKSSASVTYGGYFTSTGTGGGLKSTKTGIGFGSYGNLLGGWVRGDEYGLYASGKQYALYLDGNTYTNGYFATLQNINNKANVLYALTGTSVNIVNFGRGRLSGGRTTINFDENFSRVVSDAVPITIITTPIGECSPIYISTVSKNGFLVYESKGGNSNNEFCWIAIGVRKDYENIEVPEEILNSSFDNNMAQVAFNENTLDENAMGMWFDGYALRFGTSPSAPVTKSPEEINAVRQTQLKSLEKKLKQLKKEIRRLEKDIEKINIKGTEK